MLNGAITALATPMRENGEIDFAALDTLVKFQINNGISGLVVCGTTGESALLSNPEKITIIQHVIKLVNTSCKIIVGVSCAATHFACEFVRELNHLPGIDALLVLTPYCIKPTQEGLYKHFSQIASVSVRPVILYNVPTRTGCDLADDTALRLANDCSNIIGLKDATGDLARCEYLVAHRLHGFALYSGDDKTALEFMLRGGDGVISVVSNVAPSEFSQMCNLALSYRVDPSLRWDDKEKNLAAAKAINDKLARLYDVLFIEANPIPVKWVLFAKKIINTPSLRLPLTTLSIENQKKLKNVLVLT